MSEANLTNSEITYMKKEAAEETQKVLMALSKDYPDVVEGIATLLGTGTGAAGSLAALYGLGTVGLSAAGMTSGLAAAGAIVGGGMLAGIGVLAAPVAVLGVAGYAVAKKVKNAKRAAALGQAIGKLYDIQAKLIDNAEFFKQEIAGIKVVIDSLKAKTKPA